MERLSSREDFEARGFADRRQVNGALQPARNATMLAAMGNPRGSYGAACEPPTNPGFRALVETADLGPFRATGVRPALKALRAIMDDIANEKPAVHRAMGTVGMLCCRLVRGSSSSISNHAWGTAIDLTLEGDLDRRGDGLAQAGLFEIHPIFNRHGWFWGAAFPVEDSMHFEASDQLIRRWATEGAFGEAGRGAPAGLSFGDRGARVEALQTALNTALAPMETEVDGIFGKDTRAMLAEWQRRNGMPVTGTASPRVLAMLGV